MAQPHPCFLAPTCCATSTQMLRGAAGGVLAWRGAGPEALQDRNYPWSRTRAGQCQQLGEACSAPTPGEGRPSLHGSLCGQDDGQRDHTEPSPLSFPAMREAQFTPLSPSLLPSEDWHCHSILPLPETRQEQVQATPSAAPSAPNACCCLQTAPWAGGPGSPDELREPHRGSGGSGPRQRPELGSPPPGRSAEPSRGTGVPRPSEGGHVCLQR